MDGIGHVQANVLVGGLGLVHWDAYMLLIPSLTETHRALRKLRRGSLSDKVARTLWALRPATLGLRPVRKVTGPGESRGRPMAHSSD